MKKRYGVPYMGSKNRIAEWIVSTLPAGRRFVDLFAGGCAVTHAAIVSGKYQSFHAADISSAPSLFLNAINGAYRNEKRWISRTDFFQLKEADPYVKYCWSFGNCGSTYMYARQIEPWKKALHYARVLADHTLLRQMGITGTATRIDIKQHAEEYWQKYCRWMEETRGWEDGLKPISLENLESLQRLERLQRLQRLQSLQSLQALTIQQAAYTDYQHQPNDIVYCDIPYRGKKGYNGDTFDHEAFYAWALRQPYPVYISEYTMPEGFTPIAERQKVCTLSATNKSLRTTERIYAQTAQLRAHEMLMKANAKKHPDVSEKQVAD